MSGVEQQAIVGEQPEASPAQRKAESLLAGRLLLASAFNGPNMVIKSHDFAHHIFGRGIADLPENYDDGVSRPEKRLARRINRTRARWGQDAVSGAFRSWQAEQQAMEQAHQAARASGISTTELL